MHLGACSHKAQRYIESVLLYLFHVSRQHGAHIIDSQLKGVLTHSQNFRAFDRARALPDDAMYVTYGKPTHVLGVYSNLGIGDQASFWTKSQHQPNLHTGLRRS